MRKIALALLVCMLLALLVPLSACAEEPTAAERGLAAIKAVSSGKSIILPREDSYLEEWKTLYARKPWYQPSLQVECLPRLKSGAPLMPPLYEGTRVTVVAEENDMSCMLYPGADNKIRVGWIQSIRLLEDFPGEVFTIGTPPEDGFDVLDSVGQHWSNDFLLKSQRRYMCFDEPVKNCVGFSMQYQVVARNTGITENVYGERTLYVFDGTTWHEVGSFPYYDLSAVQVDVWFDPMDVVAFGTVADCVQPYDFDFRQFAYAFATE
ncbi:MAG: hypothetical protein K6F56_07990 [Oscillospiraceae bacterium]|nr:hypothetical protein [Oscillospiraceae bacterium]